LKIEAKSYLRTLQRLRKEDDPHFELPCEQLFNRESQIEQLEEQRTRELTAEDVLYFEHELLNLIVEFIHSLVQPSANFIKNEVFDFFLDFT
jgi:hypothetical protein